MTDPWIIREETEVSRVARNGKKLWIALFARENTITASRAASAALGYKKLWTGGGRGGELRDD